MFTFFLFSRDYWNFFLLFRLKMSESLFFLCNFLHLIQRLSQVYIYIYIYFYAHEETALYSNAYVKAHTPYLAVVCLLSAVRSRSFTKHFKASVCVCSVFDTEVFVHRCKLIAKMTHSPLHHCSQISFKLVSLQHVCQTKKKKNKRLQIFELCLLRMKAAYFPMSS